MTDESLTTNSVPQKAISIIIPTWNNATLTGRCIDSLRTNTHHQFNIIWLVDVTAPYGNPDVFLTDLEQTELKDKQICDCVMAQDGKSDVQVRGTT